MTEAQKARNVIDQIVVELDGQTWSPDTLDRIAEILRQAGYEMREPEDR